MKRFYIGIDTSNYTTSCALFEASEARFYSNVKQLLIVEEGQRGLRQSDAVFAHIKNLPKVTEEALSSLEAEKLAAVGVSGMPRDNEGSYMPCFLVGIAAASSVANAAKKPLHKFSHQAGHIMAAVWSSNSYDLLNRDFIAFHVSGGTTEILYVKNSKTDKFEITKLGGTLDLNAGQAIDRIGVLMGTCFPCGPYLEKLALENNEKLPSPKLSVNGCFCNLSGLENKAAELFKNGKGKEYIAAYTFDYIAKVLIKLTENALDGRELPVLYAGGVMSNSIIKKMLSDSGYDVRFAEPKFSSDNAAGVALLTALKEEGDKFWIK